MYRFHLAISTSLTGILLFFANTITHAAVPPSFAKGVEAFRSGDYRTAIAQFERARETGLRKVSLYYNLGVSYYKLRRYGRARYYFEKVVKNHRMAPLAYYNLGLIARKQDRRQQAEKHFARVIRVSDNKKLRYLARRNLDELRSGAGLWKGLWSARIGSDDNVTFAPIGVGQGPDNFIELRGYTRSVLSGTRRRGLSFVGDFRVVDYNSINSYDQYVLRAELKKMTVWGSWPSYYSGSFDTSTLGGSGYQNIFGAEVGARKKLSKYRSLRTFFRFESIDSQNVTYDYLQGWRTKIHIERRNYTKARKTRLLYVLELNNRQDTTTASYSPVRHTFRGVYRRPFSGSWEWMADVSFRVSDYPAVGAQNRFDQRLRYSFTVSRKILKDLKVRARFRHTDNRSSDSNYVYTGNRVYFGINYYY